MHKATRPRWDIFCQVIDNFGDIGVTWRLARQLAREHHIDVTLWVDELDAFCTLESTAQRIDMQVFDGVTIRRWSTPLPPCDAADVVIEAFACELPACYLASMKARAVPPHWINLEYLSAEQWVEDCHLLRSVSPATGLGKTFFFPGFTAKTGGLIREGALDDEHSSFSDPIVRKPFLSKIGVTNTSADALVISLFCYPNQALSGLLNEWQASSRPIELVVPQGKALESVNQYLGTSLEPGDTWQSGSLRIHPITFLTQAGYDRLLWSCDVNFVRGEDSLVRAIWAQKPYVWHIYPQSEDTHMEKLEAFLANQSGHAAADVENPLPALWRAWNREQNCTLEWQICLNQIENWQKLVNSHANSLISLGDLAAKLVHFCEKTL